MSIAKSVADVLTHHVTLELESLDRVYLNVYQPRLQTPRAMFHYLREHHGEGAVSSHKMRTISQRFITDIHRYALKHAVPIITFEKGERKEDRAAAALQEFTLSEGVLFIGKAQEKARTYRTEGRKNAHGETYPWIVESTAMVNQYYFYAVDADFGLFFLKYSSYAPYGAKVCFNGHEWLKRQLQKEKIGYEELANGILSCENPERMQQLAEQLTPERIARFIRKWQAKLPNPFRRSEQLAGYQYDVSMCQVEFALTQVMDRPLSGRVFFEEVLRENIDLGRPDNLQLIFERRITKRTPGKFRSRVVREGVIPSLHVDYKSNRIKQYYKEGRAIRTEITVQNPRDFGVNRRLEHLSELRKVAFAANQRVLHVQQTSQDHLLADATFREVTQPRTVENQRTSALRFADPVVFALLTVLLMLRFLPHGFRSRDLREHLARLLGDDPNDWTQGRLTYQLRRLRLHGLVERQPHSQRYTITARGLSVAMWFTRCESRLLRPGLGELLELPDDAPTPLRKAFMAFNAATAAYATSAHVESLKT